MTITHKFCSKLLEELLEWCLLLLLTLSRAPPLCRDGLQSDQPADELKSERKPQRSGRDSVGSGEFFKPFANNHGFKVLVEECWRQRANAAKRKREASPWSQKLERCYWLLARLHGYTYRASWLYTWRLHGLARLQCGCMTMALRLYGSTAVWPHGYMATLLHGYIAPWL